MNLRQHWKNLRNRIYKDNIRQNMKITDWYDGEIKPVYVGVYERKSEYGFSHFSYYNGKSWKQMAFTPEKALKLLSDDDSLFQSLKWRGVAK